MPYYRCPECALTAQSTTGRFTAKSCPRCGVPLVITDRVYASERRPAAISRRFAAEPRAAHAARRTLAPLRSELSPAQFYLAGLLTTELIANAVQHGGGVTRANVRLEVALTDDQLRIEVGDDGRGFVPAPRPPGAPLDSHWGLHLVEQLADRWGVTAEPETTVWFELVLEHGAHGANGTSPEGIAVID
ncbi:MAG TPA: ATP-binding protein [Thermoleophilaceae bacterium]